MPDLVEPDDREWTIGRAIRNGGHHHPTIEGAPWPPVDEPVVVVPKSRLEAGAVAGTDRQSAAIRQELADMAEVAYRGNEREKVLEAQVAAGAERERALEAERDEARFLADARGAEKDRHRREKLKAEAQVRALTDALAELVRLKDLKDAGGEWLGTEKEAAWRAARAALPVPDEEEADR